MALPGCAVTSKNAATPAVAKRALIDVHHHIWAPNFLKELEARKLAEPPARNWSLNKTMDDMAQAGVTYTLTSPTTPAASFGDVQTMRAMARISNEYGAQLARDYPQMTREMQMGPDTGFAHGGSTNPDYMRAEMAVNGFTPSKYAGGSTVTNEMDPQETRRGDNRRIPTIAELKRYGAKGAKFGLGTALPGYFAYEGLTAMPENFGTGDYGTGAANAIFGTSGMAQAMPKTTARMIGPAATSTLSKAWMPLLAGQMLGHHGDLNEGEQEQLRLAQGYIDAEKDPFFEGSVFSAQKR
jgi:hypothetical protein